MPPPQEMPALPPMLDMHAGRGRRNFAYHGCLSGGYEDLKGLDELATLTQTEKKLTYASICEGQTFA